MYSFFLTKPRIDNFYPSTFFPYFLKNVGFTVTCEQCKKPRLIHSKKKLNVAECNLVKRIGSKFSYVCGSVFSEYLGTGGERNNEKEVAAKVYIRENISCTSKMELPYYSIDFFPKVCIYCGIKGSARILGNSEEFYPKCGNCSTKGDVPRRKRKTVVASDLKQKKKK